MRAINLAGVAKKALVRRVLFADGGLFFFRRVVMMFGLSYRLEPSGSLPGPFFVRLSGGAGAK